ARTASFQRSAHSRISDNLVGRSLTRPLSLVVAPHFAPSQCDGSVEQGQHGNDVRQPPRSAARGVQAHHSATDTGLADRIGITRQTLVQWRNGELRSLPTQANLRAMATEIRRPYRQVLAAALFDTGYRTPTDDGTPRPYDEVLHDAIAALTEAAHLTNQPMRQNSSGQWEADPDPRAALPIDWAEFVTRALGGRARAPNPAVDRRRRRRTPTPTPNRTCRHSLEFDTTWPCGGCSGEHDWLIRDSVTGHLLLSDLWSIQRISHPQTRLLVSPSAPPTSPARRWRFHQTGTTRKTWHASSPRSPTRGSCALPERLESTTAVWRYRCRGTRN